MEDEEAPIEKKRGYYTFKDNWSPPFYFAFNDEVLVITSDKGVIKTFGDGGPDDNLLNTDYGKGIKNNNIYGSLNLDLDKFKLKNISFEHLHLNFWLKIKIVFKFIKYGYFFSLKKTSFR